MFTTPSLNDKMFLNNKGITMLQNLEEFTGLKALFLEGNGLESLEGLETLTQLKCLYAQKNFLHQLDGLEHLSDTLDTLNVSNNRLEALEGVSELAKLATLQASHNQLATADAIEELRDCKNVSVLDLSQNKLDDVAIVDTLAAMPALRVLYLSGNPAVSKVPHYRKTMVSRCKGLTFLDDRPVFEKERRCSEAWADAVARGEDGIAAERAMRKTIVEEEDAAKEANFQFMKKMREGSRRRRLVREGRVDLSAFPPDAALEDLPDEVFASALAEVDAEDEDVGEYIPPQEPPELVAAREALVQSGWRPPAGEEEPSDITALRARMMSGMGSVGAAAPPPAEVAAISAPAATSAPATDGVSVGDSAPAADGASAAESAQEEATLGDELSDVD